MSLLWILALLDGDGLREMSTDRPDKTESATTVDAGHLQIEMELATYSSDRPDRDLALATFNTRFGVTDDLELGLIIAAYERQQGFGDTVLRAKLNLLGNDGGSFSLGLLPFLTLPTHHGDSGGRHVQGGLIVPLSVDLPLDFSLGAMTEVDLVRNGSWDAVFVNSVSLGHGLLGGLSGYVEFYSAVVARGGRDWVGTLDTGLKLPVSADVQLDGGANWGVTRAAPDREFFAGISWRF